MAVAVTVVDKGLPTAVKAVATGGKRSLLLLRPGFVKRLYTGYYKMQ
ncbi:MAG: hypothetical protein QXJ95_09395 [Ignisphaera sp.]